MILQWVQCSGSGFYGLWPMNAQRVIGVTSLLPIGGLIRGYASVQVREVSVAQVNDPAIARIWFFQPQPYLAEPEML